MAEPFRSATFAQSLVQARKAAYNSRKYTFPSFKVGDEMFLSRKLSTDASLAARPSMKLCVKKIGPFKITEIIGKNAVRVALPKNINIHPVIHVEHTIPAHHQPADISSPTPAPSQQYIDETGENVIEVEKILSHRRRGRGWQFLTKFKNAPLHEAE